VMGCSFGVFGDLFTPPIIAPDSYHSLVTLRVS
jgi:hypothetical protein